MGWHRFSAILLTTGKLAKQSQCGVRSHSNPQAGSPSRSGAQHNALKQWLDKQLLGLSPKSELATAITYLTKRWSCFSRYTQDGQMLMHNNPGENAVRGVVLGRINYLFSGSDQGGECAAMFYSLIETCKLKGINPYAYLCDVLSRLPTHPANRIEELIPYNRIPAQ